RADVDETVGVERDVDRLVGGDHVHRAAVNTAGGHVERCEKARAVDVDRIGAALAENVGGDEGGCAVDIDRVIAVDAQGVFGKQGECADDVGTDGQAAKPKPRDRRGG